VCKEHIGIRENRESRRHAYFGIVRSEIPIRDKTVVTRGGHMDPKD
jgi:hypothetical protein